MYTNTPKDNHWFGIAPFLFNDPLTPRNWLHRNIMPYINWFVFWFGIIGNAVIHSVQMLQGIEVMHYGFLLKPIQFAILSYHLGLKHGALTMFV